MAKMTRTQISLDPEDIELLDEAARETGATRAELIRRAVRAYYARPSHRRGTTPEERVARARSAFGIWRDRPFTTEEYLHAIRHGKALPDE
mgnify:CR=1 FL=1